MIDAHAHLYTDALKDDLSNIVKRFRAVGGKYIINAGVDPETNQTVLSQAQEFPILHPTAGLHPELTIPGCDIYVKGLDEKWIERQMKNLHELFSKHDNLVAVGECGLDYYWIKHERLLGRTEIFEQQKRLLSEQVKLAKERDLPLVIHCRDELGDKQAEAEALEILIKDNGGGVKALFHSYTGSLSYLEDILGLGYYVSFNAIVMFKSADNVRELLDATPLEQLLFETDSPWLVPQNHRAAGAKVCEPMFVGETAEYVAKRKSVSVERLWNHVEENSEKLFGVS